MANMVAKTTGIIIDLPIYNIANSANNPIIKILALTKNGSFETLVSTGFAIYSFFFENRLIIN